MTQNKNPENLNNPPTKKSGPQDLAGTVLLERYRLIRKLGGGGMGDVYLGEHTVIGKQVAVKVLHPQYSEDREVVERFLQEARSASRIGHANIVDIADYGQSEEGLVFLVMEYLEGEELGDLLHREKRIPWQR
ncbi:protein kinase, partial [Myxococcota bacterium]|nr:protein kinase [Myxococcota bacterium]